MFPLGTPLLPGSLLPLHVFELRYQIMMDDVMAREPHEFGVVMIERGYEVGGGDVRAGIGTLALVARSEEVDDGRRMVLAVGTSRIRVV
ncbi:MAG: LON peptidase substrate-binding domain-containing protein, partial [Ilumatobacteraceae bacterium]